MRIKPFLTPALTMAVASSLLAAAAPALAQTAAPRPTQVTRVSTALPQRVVLICESDSATRSAFVREYGSEPVFMTAREAVDARAQGQEWTTPRCMTEREHGRYLQLTQAFAAR